jgi:hypothetical protein
MVYLLEQGAAAGSLGPPIHVDPSAVRCSGPIPERPRIAEIRDNLAARIAEAEHEG